MLKNLKVKNPQIEFYNVEFSEFETFGRIISGMNIAKITEAAKQMEEIAQGSAYIPAVDSFQKLNIADELRKEIFGESDIQVGYCWGHSCYLNATEWHKSNEINIAVTPFVIILGHIWDIKNGIIDSSNFKAFYVPEGTVIEIYATTLHFCPCQVSDNGFGCVVALPKDTNTPLDGEYENSLMFRKNKWLLAHVENKELIEKGVKPGITGENYKIKY